MVYILSYTYFSFQRSKRSNLVIEKINWYVHIISICTMNYISLYTPLVAGACLAAHAVELHLDFYY